MCVMAQMDAARKMAIITKGGDACREKPRVPAAYVHMRHIAEILCNGKHGEKDQYLQSTRVEYVLCTNNVRLSGHQNDFGKSHFLSNVMEIVYSVTVC